ncbi:MAG: hypothetical protein JNL54_16550 [Kineosporiaceae bacterium]|nr:hypothetical protein [Kineosporiaceae bacterium]
MTHVAVVQTLLSLLRERWSGHRRDAGSVSVEQVIITAGLVTVTVVAIAALTAGVAKYAGKI